jgi:hypothetical protein
MTPAAPLVLSPEAAAYARARGGALTVRASPRHGCCGGTVGVPVAEAAAPPDPAAYRRADADGVAVYLDPALGGAPLGVGLNALLGMRSLYVEALLSPA